MVNANDIIIGLFRENTKKSCLLKISRILWITLA